MTLNRKTIALLPRSLDLLGLFLLLVTTGRPTLAQPNPCIGQDFCFWGAYTMHYQDQRGCSSDCFAFATAAVVKDNEGWLCGPCGTEQPLKCASIHAWGWGGANLHTSFIWGTCSNFWFPFGLLEPLLLSWGWKCGPCRT